MTTDQYDASEQCLPGRTTTKQQQTRRQNGSLLLKTSKIVKNRRTLWTATNGAGEAGCVLAADAVTAS